MCGIAGIVTPEVLQYEYAIRRMMDALRHRGPDDSGVYFFKNCVLAHRRLSIVDLQTGQQPMLSSCSPVGITFNGEIYGFKEIRDRLDHYVFTTASDTEVIIALYHQYGHELLAHLPGMFAFGLWDDGTEELLCARDRFGEKPLYYAFGPRGEFLFASEIKAILASGLVRPALNSEALAHYLQYLYVPPWDCIYRNVHTIPPAHSLRYRKGRVSVECYWRLPVPHRGIRLTDAVEEFRTLFERSVRRQLVADVPIGFFLSGGVDSSTVVAVASEFHENLNTFSFRFKGTESELPFAREVANAYRTNHVELSDEESNIGELMVEMQHVFDEPFADSSNIPTYLIAKLARQHIKVALTGDGGDELLSGYSFWYQPLLHMQLRKRNLWPVFFLSFTKRIQSLLGRHLTNRQYYEWCGIQYGRQFRTIAEAHRFQKKYFRDDELNRLGFRPPRDLSLDGDPSNTLEDALRMDLKSYLPGDILVKIDRTAMAHGLELRAPFLDVDFASFCISIPYQLKIEQNQDKLILRKAFGEIWPEVIQRRPKQGFGAPVRLWLKQKSVEELKEGILNDRRHKIFSIIPHEVVRVHAEGNDYKTWILLVLALWLDQHEWDLEEGSQCNNHVSKSECHYPHV
jgi:asparagine synthase (glutamine-hydrolysing)